MINLMRTASVLFSGFLAVGSLQAHDVIWLESFFDPFGNSPMELNFGPDAKGNPDSATIAVLPSADEPCIVEVNLDPTTSPAIATSFVGGVSVANAVFINVTVQPIMATGTVTTVVSGEWHATGSPSNAGCTATNPNPFSVPVTIKNPRPWKIEPGIMPWTVQIDTIGTLTGLRSANTLAGPWYNIGFGSNFTVTSDQSAQFFKGTHQLGSAFGGIITDGSGAPQSGFSIGLQYGNFKSMTLSDGSFSFYALPQGTNVIAVTKTISFVDPATSSNRTEDVSLNLEVPATNPTNILYQMLQLKVAMLLFPLPACNCTPWCAIGVGTLNGVQTPVYYSGGAIPPKSGPANCGPVQVTVTPPSGVAYPITAGSGKRQNSGPNPATGTWTVTTTVCGQSKQASTTVP